MQALLHMVSAPSHPSYTLPPAYPGGAKRAHAPRGSGEVFFFFKFYFKKLSSQHFFIIFFKGRGSLGGGKMYFQIQRYLLCWNILENKKCQSKIYLPVGISEKIGLSELNGWALIIDLISYINMVNWFCSKTCLKNEHDERKLCEERHFGVLNP